MNKSEIDKIVELAEHASNKVQIANLKEETYRIVLTELLKQKVAPEKSLPQLVDPIGPSPIAPSRALKTDSPATKVAAWVGTSEDQLSEIYEFGEDSVNVRLAHKLLPNKMAEVQKLLAHLKLSADKIGYEIDEVSSKDMMDMFDEHGCKDGNVAKNLKGSEYIVSKGTKGTMKTYKLRYSGLNATLVEIKNVLGITS